MLREAGLENESTWGAAAAGHALHGEWQLVDRELRSIARRRAGLDAEEARWLREAERCKIWRPLGMVSIIDYMERVLGYAPRTAQDRLRVARALGALPALTGALALGELSFSAIRELTRVATPLTEIAWRDAAMTKNLREIEELVADHRPGDRPEDPGDPEARMRVVRFELSAETFAVLRQARQIVNDEAGRQLSDDELVAALCNGVLDGATASEPTGRAKFQIAMVVCDRCRQGWQEGAGVRIAVDAATVERAYCDAQYLGSLDGGRPERAYQDVAPSVARFVWRRDAGRCRVPGCRSARGLEIHHLIHRVDGGTHDASNLALLCSACHTAHHSGALTIEGNADRFEVRRGVVPYPDVSAAQADATGRGVGVKGPTAYQEGDGTRAVDSSGAHVGIAQAEGRARGPDMESEAARAQATQRAAVSSDGAHVGAARADEQARDGRVARGPASTLAAACAASAGSRGSGSAVGTEGAHVGAHRTQRLADNALDAAVCRAQAKEVLMRIGWKPAVAKIAVDGAMLALDADAILEDVIREALRRCPLATS